MNSDMVRLAIDFENPAQEWWEGGGRDLWESIVEGFDNAQPRRHRRHGLGRHRHECGCRRAAGNLTVGQRTVVGIAHRWRAVTNTESV